VKDIIADPITKLSLEYWAPNSPHKHKAFDPKIIEDIYYQQLVAQDDFNTSKIMLLELSLYLENYLWPNFNAEKSTHAHLISIMLMVNEKCRENVVAWDAFQKHNTESFGPFFTRVLNLRKSDKLSMRERLFYLTFIINCFQSLETKLVREQCLRLVSMQLWHSLDEERRQYEMRDLAKLQRLWKSAQKKAGDEHERGFMVALIQDFNTTLNSITPKQADKLAIQFCERFLELLLDLLTQLPTRRLFRVVMEYYHVTVASKLSALHDMPQGQLFRQLLQMVKFYQGFELNDYTGQALSDEDVRKQHYERIQRLQQLVFKHVPQLRAFALAAAGTIDTRSALKSHLSALDTDTLRDLCTQLALIGAQNSRGEESKELLLELIITAHERRVSQTEAINMRSLYPDETIIWDENMIPSGNFTGAEVLALPKLNLQFLTFYDYLLKNFTLYRLESTYEIRQDIEDSIRRIQPRLATGETVFRGWSRMALPINSFNITRVLKPNLGDSKPALVSAEVSYYLPSKNQQIRWEWDNVKQHDIIFLVTVQSPIREGDAPNHELPFREQYGVITVRGCEVNEVVDESGNVLSDLDEGRERRGNKRTLRVFLDPAQYQQDINENGRNTDLHRSFNLIVRRKAKENNFKAVLDTIRGLMNTKVVVPDWLKDVMLGYGDPASCQNVDKTLTIDFNDTFIDAQHLRAVFSEHQVKFNGAEQPPFRVTFPADDKSTALAVQPYALPSRGPYPQDKPKHNTVPFTTAQVTAIKTAMNTGLTMVVGPPGTGKTDVAVQIISNWYHNFPTQRTVIITHSNQALNQIFEKIMRLDIDERHLIRLGHGQEMLETEKDFSKYGRVNYMLQLRLDMLKEAARLAVVMRLPEEMAYTCETSENFYRYHVVARWEEFLYKSSRDKSKESVKKSFPFSEFFADVQPLFKEESYEEDMEMAEGCFRHIEQIFAQLRDCRAFELLKLGGDRSNYLLTKQARIIAMTCTHAALKRQELIKLGFKYDNILMEEAAQVLEIESFVPLMLQEQDPEAPPRLKRIVMIGDHNQLPPVVKNIAIQKFGHLDQSLFTRFVRLNVPNITLNAQGRARPSLAELYNWRYNQLGNLPHVLQRDEFQTANAGFAYDYQLINVEDYLGQGESEPNPYFYQNLGEAEYLVAVYMYMRLLGIPNDKISIITSYNGQKHLIRDVIKQRCAWNPLFGAPAKITTVDRYQGQQNDYILLSLVRTKTVGHIRDVRRLVVAMSRARLGLYVFCRKSLFANCYELTNTFSKLLQRPDKLVLVKDERYPTPRRIDEQLGEDKVFTVEDVVHMGQIVAPPEQPAATENGDAAQSEATNDAQMSESDQNNA
jgi:intron-binding protein aquarius